MKIFAIGLHKTGTSSIAEALRRLGYRTAHHSGHQQRLAHLNRHAGRRLFYGMDHAFDAFSDQPCGVEYARLDQDYPGSLFIWTHRDLVSWIRSVERMNLVNIRNFSRGMDSEMDYDKWIAMYKKHMEELPQHFAGRSDFLSFPICDGKVGWQELCSFLGLPVPDAKFPHVNIGLRSYGPYKPIPRLTYRSEVKCPGEKDSPSTSTKKGC